MPSPFDPRSPANAPAAPCQELLLTPSAWRDVGRMTAAEFERLREALEQLRTALGPGENAVSVGGYGIEVVVQEDGRGLVVRIHLGDE